MTSRHVLQLALSAADPSHRCASGPAAEHRGAGARPVLRMRRLMMLPKPLPTLLPKVRP